MVRRSRSRAGCSSGPVAATTARCSTGRTACSRAGCGGGGAAAGRRSGDEERAAHTEPSRGDVGACRRASVADSGQRVLQHGCGRALPRSALGLLHQREWPEQNASRCWSGLRACRTAPGLAPAHCHLLLRRTSPSRLILIFELAGAARVTVAPARCHATTQNGSVAAPDRTSSRENRRARLSNGLAATAGRQQQ